MQPLFPLWGVLWEKEITCRVQNHYEAPQKAPNQLLLRWTRQDQDLSQNYSTLGGR